jgi:hypothetical protein
VAVQTRPHISRDKQEILCSYWLPGQGYGVTITDTTHQTPADFERSYRAAREAKGQRASRRSGIGSAAVLITVGSRQQYRVIAVLAGRIIFTVSDLTGKSSLARDEALAKRLVRLEKS